MRLLRVREWESCIIILHMAEMGPVWEGGNVFKGYKLQSGGKGNAAHGKGKVGKFSPFLFMCWCLRRCGERVLLIDVTHNDWDLGWLRPVSFPSPLVLDRASGLGKLTGLGPQPPPGWSGYFVRSWICFRASWSVRDGDCVPQYFELRSWREVDLAHGGCDPEFIFGTDQPPVRQILKTTVLLFKSTITLFQLYFCWEGRIRWRLMWRRMAEVELYGWISAACQDLEKKWK